MQWLNECVGCELAVTVGVVIVWMVLLDISDRMKRKWGENPKKWWKR